MTGLCQLAKDWDGSVPPGGLLSEEKRDGFRCLFLPDINGKERLFTRNGMPIEGCDHILYHLQRMREAAGQPLFIDGELVVDGTLAATKRWVESGWRKGGEAGHFHAFDYMTHEEWAAGGSDAPLYQRKARLRDLVEQASADDWDWRPGSHGRDEGAIPVTLVEDQWVFDRADVMAEANRVWAIEGEGLMLKDPEAPYRRNRNASWQKVKTCNLHKWKDAAWAVA